MRWPSQSPDLNPTEHHPSLHWYQMLHCFCLASFLSLEHAFRRLLTWQLFLGLTLWRKARASVPIPLCAPFTQYQSSPVWLMQSLSEFVKLPQELTWLAYLRLKQDFQMLRARRNPLQVVNRKTGNQHLKSTAKLQASDLITGPSCQSAQLFVVLILFLAPFTKL